MFVPCSFPVGFNETWLALLAKCSSPADNVTVVRPASEVRAVGVQNGDCKLCSAALNQPLANALDGYASNNQFGFTPRRVLADAVLRMDVAMRIAATLPWLLPVMVVFDFEQAFPSVAWGLLVSGS